jgi:predicted amidophosphoribosyltransferase
MTLMTEFRSTVGSIAGRALEFALPATCAGCYLAGTLLCRECRALLVLGLEADPVSRARPAAELPAPLFQLEWCARFGGIAHRALNRLGEVGDRRLSGPLGEAIAARWASAGAGGDVLVPVPPSNNRTRERSHDHAVLLARAAGRRLRLPVVEALGRRHEGEWVNGETFEVIAADRIDGLAVVLVDGVVATGATLAACATVLLAAGARVVSAVTVARAHHATAHQVTARPMAAPAAS